jgi:hypothetical protein
MTERLGVISAMKRSWNLVSDRWCFVFGLSFINGTIGIVFFVIWKNIFNYNVYTFYGSIMNLIPGLIVYPIMAVMMTVMYINLRVEKEGLNAEVFARELDAAAEAYDSLMNPGAQEEIEEKELAVSNVV